MLACVCVYVAASHDATHAIHQPPHPQLYLQTHTHTHASVVREKRIPRKTQRAAGHIFQMIIIPYDDGNRSSVPPPTERARCNRDRRGRTTVFVLCSIVRACVRVCYARGRAINFLLNQIDRMHASVSRAACHTHALAHHARTGLMMRTCNITSYYVMGWDGVWALSLVACVIT